MGGGTADEIPRLEPILDHRCHSLPIPGELMVDIFLRLSSPADLARASATCVSFRRVVTDRSFLRRYRKLHAAPLLGFLDEDRTFHPAIASAANAVALTADFSFSFLPAPASDWSIQDVRDSRVLLYNRNNIAFQEQLVVCDPLHRRYMLLPRIPGNLTASVDCTLCTDRFHGREIFLAPFHEEDETSFSVIWMMHCATKLPAVVFSSSSAQWRAISSQIWSGLLAGLPSSTRLPLFSSRQYAYGCFYWLTHWREKFLVLDTMRMEFSSAETPPEARGLPFYRIAIAIVDAGEGRLGMFVLPHNGNCLNYTTRRNSSSQWLFEKTVSLDYGYLFIGSAGRCLFLYHGGSPSIDAGCFLLDIKTFKLERVFVSNSCNEIHAYNNFPPSLLSTPTVLSGVENRAEKEMLKQGCGASSDVESSRSE